MALRPGRILKEWKRPWTRVSKSKPRKSYVVGVPIPKLHVFEMGNRLGEFDTELYMISNENVQIRHNALEAARIVSHKYLENKVGGPQNYFYKMLVFPHNVMREHSIATGAGADRFSQGMRHAFGRPVGTSAIIKAGQRVIMVRVNKEHLADAKEALRRAKSKIRCTISIEVRENA